MFGGLQLVGLYLNEAGAALVELRRERMALASMTSSYPDRSLLFALCTGFATAYARCFKTAGRHHRLVASETFVDDEIALREHEYLFAMRHKHFAHDVNDRRRTLVMAILDHDGQVLRIGHNEAIADESELIVNNGTLLVQHAKRYLTQRLIELEAQLRGELAAMSPKDRLALPEPIFESVRPETVSEARGRKR